MVEVRLENISTFEFERQQVGTPETYVHSKAYFLTTENTILQVQDLVFIKWISLAAASFTCLYGKAIQCRERTLAVFFSNIQEPRKISLKHLIINEICHFLQKATGRKAEVMLLGEKQFLNYKSHQVLEAGSQFSHEIYVSLSFQLPLSSVSQSCLVSIQIYIAIKTQMIGTFVNLHLQIFLESQKWIFIRLM